MTLAKKEVWLAGTVMAAILLLVAGPAAADFPPAALADALNRVSANENTETAQEALENLNLGTVGLDLATLIRNENADDEDYGEDEDGEDGGGPPPGVPSIEGLTNALSHVSANEHTDNAQEVLQNLIDERLAASTEAPPELESSGCATLSHAPEPATIALMSLGLGAVMALRKKR